MGTAKQPTAKRKARPAKDRLTEYAAKRDFAKTAEPGPTPTSRTDRLPLGHRFVVQRHRARRLHYDLRLEMDGTLVSWAVPKGPTLDPKEKRMAVHVEDHPRAYFDFEGVIPKGEYGGGDVVVWDWGTWEPADTDDPRQAVEDHTPKADIRRLITSLDHPDCIVYGHTHRPSIEHKNGVLFINPGSAGAPRHGESACVAIVRLSDADASAQLVCLPE